MASNDLTAIMVDAARLCWLQENGLLKHKIVTVCGENKVFYEIDFDKLSLDEKLCVKLLAELGDDCSATCLADLQALFGGQTEITCEMILDLIENDADCTERLLALFPEIDTTNVTVTAGTSNVTVDPVVDPQTGDVEYVISVTDNGGGPDTNTINVDLAWDEDTDTISFVDSDGNTLSTVITGFIEGLTITGQGDVNVTGNITDGFVVGYTDIDTVYTYTVEPNAAGTGFDFTAFLNGVEDGTTFVPWPAGGDTDTDTVYVLSNTVNPNGGIDLSWQLTDVASGNSIGAPIEVLCLQQRLLDCDGVALAKDSQVVTKDRLVSRLEFNPKAEVIDGVSQTTVSVFDGNDDEVITTSFDQAGSKIKYGPGELIENFNGNIKVMVQADLTDPATYRQITFNPAQNRVVPENYKGFVLVDRCAGTVCPMDAPRRGCLDLTRPVGGGVTLGEQILADPDVAAREGVIVLNGIIIPRADCWEEYIAADETRWKALENQGWVSQSDSTGAGSVSAFSSEFNSGTLVGTHSDGQGNDTPIYIPATANIAKADLAGLVRPTCKAVPIDTDGDGMLDGYEIVVDLIAPQTLDGIEFSFDGQTFGPLGGTTVSEAALPGWADADCVFIQPIVSCDGINIPMDCKTLVQPCKTTSEFLFPIANIGLTVCMYFNDTTAANSAVNWGPHFPERSCIRFEGLTNVPGNRTLNSPQIPYTNTFDCPVELCASHATALHYRSEDQFGDTGQASYTFDTMLGDAANVDNLVTSLYGDAVGISDLNLSIGDGTRLADRNSGTIGPFCPTNTGTNDSVYQVTHLERFKCLLMPGESATIATAQILARGNDGLGPDQVRFHHTSRMWATTELMKNKV